MVYQLTVSSALVMGHALVVMPAFAMRIMRVLNVARGPVANLTVVATGAATTEHASAQVDSVVQTVQSDNACRTVQTKVCATAQTPQQGVCAFLDLPVSHATRHLTELRINCPTG